MTLCPNNDCPFNAIGECQHGIFQQFDIPIQACQRWQQYGMIHRQGPKHLPKTAFKKQPKKKPIQTKIVEVIGH